MVSKVRMFLNNYDQYFYHIGFNEENIIIATSTYIMKMIKFSSFLCLIFMTQKDKDLLKYIQIIF